MSRPVEAVLGRGVAELFLTLTGAVVARVPKMVCACFDQNPAALANGGIPMPRSATGKHRSGGAAFEGDDFSRKFILRGRGGGERAGLQESQSCEQRRSCR